MAGSVLGLIAAAWVACQVFRGEALQRLNVVKD